MIFRFFNIRLQFVRKFELIAQLIINDKINR